MAKPSESELQQAIMAAVRMRESDKDPDFMAKSLLNLNYRVKKLERLMVATRRYLHAGQSASDHKKLMVLIQEAEKASAVIEEDDLPILGLGRERED